MLERHDHDIEGLVSLKSSDLTILYQESSVVEGSEEAPQDSKLMSQVGLLSPRSTVQLLKFNEKDSPKRDDARSPGIRGGRASPSRRSKPTGFRLPPKVRYCRQSSWRNHSIPSLESGEDILPKDRVQKSSGTKPKSERRSRRIGRVSVRILRAQEKASIVIQKLARRFLARIAHQKASLMRDYKKYIKGRNERKVMQETQLHQLEEALLGLGRQTEADIKNMRLSMEEKTQHFESVIREEVKESIRKQHTESPIPKDAKRPSLSILESLAELEKEERVLKAAQSDLNLMLAETIGENTSLRHANEDMQGMFTRLNEFAKEKMEEKKELVEAQREAAKVLIPKFRRDIAAMNSAGMVETAVKDVYRGYMYKNFQAILNSDAYDEALYEESMVSIQECEIYLGNEVLEPDQHCDEIFAERDVDYDWGEDPDVG
jgi:hypothetical protein